MATIGKSTDGSITTFNALRSYGTIVAPYTYTAVAGDVITQMHIRGGVNTANPANLTLQCYTVVAGVPAVRIAANVALQMTSATIQWWSTGALSIPLTAGVEYCIAFAASTDYFVRRDSVTNGTSVYDINPLQAVWIHGFNFGVVWSLYADVVNSPPPTADIIYPCCAQLIT